MQIAARFSIAVHVLSLLGVMPEQEPTSEFLAGSIGVNPVVVRRVIGMLRDAGLVETHQGRAGARLAKSLAEVTLLDVFRAVDAVDRLFAFHENPNPNCPVGANIQTALEGELSSAQSAMELHLSRVTLSSIVDRVLTLSQ